jgi:DNA primase small subunit
MTSSLPHEQRGKFLQLMFQDYYREKSNRVDIPQRIETREFATESWGFSWKCMENQSCGRDGISFKRISECPNCGHGISITKWTRHIGYKSSEALLKNLIMSAPHSVYHSAAFYSIPVARMAEKGWQGAELVFDIDADHLDAPCMHEHDAWLCNNRDCGETGTGPAPDECPKCEEQSFTTRKWVCDRCLEEAKQNTKKIYDDFLVSDFGIDPDLVQLNYSGHRGYHIRVRDPNLFKLDSAGRVEIIHYITGLGLSSERLLSSARTASAVPPRTMSGWAGKMADAMVEFIRDIDDYPEEERWSKSLKESRGVVVQGLLRRPPILSSKAGGIGLKSWQEIAAKSAILYGGETDIPVTHDIHRVIRLIGSLNGKTGFRVEHLTREELDDFDPFRDALAFTEGTLKIKVISGPLPIPKFWIGETSYGPFLDEILELPMPAATFLLCKEVATIA